MRIYIQKVLKQLTAITFQLKKVEYNNICLFVDFNNYNSLQLFYFGDNFEKFYYKYIGAN